MVNALSEFVNDHSNKNLDEIEKFKHLRDNEYASLGFAFVFAIIVVIIYEILGFQASGVPYPDLILYTIPFFGVLAGIFYYVRLKSGSTTYHDVTAYEAAKVLECYYNGNIESAFHHLENLEDEATYTGNDAISDDIEDSISTYYEQAKGEPNRAKYLNDTLEDFMEIVVEHLEEKARLREITSSGSPNAQGTNATGENYDIDTWNLLTAVVLIIVLGAFIFAKTSDTQLPIATSTIPTLGVMILSAIVIFKS